MKRLIATLMAMGIGFTAGAAPTPARAENLSATTPASPDLEMQRIVTLLATSVLAQFAAQASRGSLDGFDPGPAMESTLRNALASRELQGLIDRIVEQAGSGAEGSALSPEMRALIKAALSSAAAIARAEISRSLAGDTGAGQRPPP